MSGLLFLATPQFSASDLNAKENACMVLSTKTAVCSILAYYACVSTPLEEAIMPCRRGSTSVACRSALANALNVASTMWWLFRPPSWRMCSVMPDVLASDWKKCSTSWVSYFPMFSVGN